MKVLLVGPSSYVGGVSMHLQRLRSLLNDQIDYLVIDDSPLSVNKSGPNIRNYKRFLDNLKFFHRNDVVHIHSGHWLLRILLIVLARATGTQVVVTLHSFRVSGIQLFLSRLALRLSSRIICVNYEVKSSVRLFNRTVVKEAFLPPSGADFKGLPNDIDFLLSHKSESILICANAYKLTRFEGEDLYGLDQCIDVARMAKEKRRNIFIVFVVATLEADNLLVKAAREAIIKYELQERIAIYPRALSFVSLIKRCDVVIRPTRTDGDALTIREALYLGKSVIASDVVRRPEGTVLYKTGSSEDLFQAIEKVSDNPGASQSAGRCQDQQSYVQFYLGVYKHAANYTKA